MEFDARLLLTVGGMLVSIVSAFVIVKTKLQTTIDQLADIESRLRVLDKNTDKQEVELSKHDQSLKTFGDMLSPKERENRAMVMADIQARLNATEAEVQRLRALHNGRHPEVQK